MITPLDPRDDAEGPAVLDLQRASYAVEAALLGVATLPPERETLAELRATRLVWLGERDDEGLAGAVAYARAGDEVDIHRLCVHPRAFRRGVASRLLDAVDACEASARRYTVGTGAANAPARALYEARGYRVSETREVEPGLEWVRMDRRCA